ncbi:MAG: hypothetical protein FD143_2642 [Ignavibacteria bacterium]|nr:MAG: hypothetical protein FD143_2642 [Ignavibacteria bacterium]KAF0156188.1 MAG: hypothetical protein FD188_3001 [Ignavibacteria bacterium]
MKKNIFLLAFVLVLSIPLAMVNAQSTLTCKVDGDNYAGAVADAVRVTIANEDFLLIRTQYENNGLHLYIKLTKLTGEFPVTLKYAPHSAENQALPDAEVIWVPDPEQPQWNTIEGELVVSAFDPDNKTIAGSFEFVVEKAEYGSKKKKTLDVDDGNFSVVNYKIDEPAKK